jgi:hypothetical protein
MNAGGLFDWFGCIQKAFPTYQCIPAPVPQAQYAVRPVGSELSCVTSVNYYVGLQNAVNLVPAGATIVVCPGNPGDVYAEQVLITKSLSLVGFPVKNGTTWTYPTVTIPSNFGYTTFPGGNPLYPFAASLQKDGNPVAAQIAAVGKCNVNISNIVVEGPGTNLSSTLTTDHVMGIYYQNASGTITNNQVTEEFVPADAGNVESGYGILVESGGTTGSANVAISNNAVVDFQSAGIIVDGASTTVQITGNWVAQSYLGALQTYPAGIYFQNAAGSICNNTVHNIKSSVPAPSFGIYDDASNGLTISENVVTVVDAPIVIQSDTAEPAPGNANGTADHNTITSNTVSGTNYQFAYNSTLTAFADGIDVCSNFNTISGNIVNPSATGTLNSGIHLDSACPSYASPDLTSGNSNFVEFNLINGGVLVGIAEGGDNNNVWYNSVDGSSASQAVYGGDYVGVKGAATTGNFNLDDVLNNPLGQSLNQLLEQIFAPQLLVSKH